jgi:hypothetical protein
MSAGGANDNDEDLGALAAAMAAGGSHIGLDGIVKSCGKLSQDIGRFHPVKLAATFGGLLTQRSLQTHCLRLEALVHLSIALGNGQRAATADLLTQGFASVGSAYGHNEDPPEDVFVGNIASKKGNYLVLEGIWESGTFYLQRFVNLVDRLPDAPQFRGIADAVYSLLKLSDLVCKRAGLQRNVLGSATRSRTLPRKLAERSGELRALVQFSFAELDEVGVKLDDLRPFVFKGSRRSELLKQGISHTDLERRPLAAFETSLFLALPTAVSVAVRRFLVETLGSGVNTQTMVQALAREYSALFAHNPMLGHRREPLPFFHGPLGPMCVASVEVDDGRHLILLFVLDDLNDFDADGFAGMSMTASILQQDIARAVNAAQDECARTAGFRNGIALVVGCGVGRGAAFAAVEDRPGWEVEYMSAPDFCTLGWSKNMKPLQLWRLFMMRSELRRMGVRLQNVNGLLNLVAWADSLDGHLVPHAEIPESATEQPLFLAIQQNSLLDLRHDVATACDFHAAPFIDGSWHKVQIEGRTLFEEDRRQPVYGSLSALKTSTPLGVCVTAGRAWWFQVVSPAGDASTSSYERWRMLGTWCARAVAHLEAQFGSRLGNGPILWQCIFTEPPQAIDSAQSHGTSTAEQAIDVDIDAPRRSVQLTIRPEFDTASFHTENVAEAALVQAYVRGVALLAGVHDCDGQELLARIIPSKQARQSHAFAARTFRDFIPTLRGREPIVIGEYDAAAIKLGLGWKSRDRELGGIVEGKDQCVAYLNSLVRCLEDELCKELRTFNRKSVLSVLLDNYEVASASRDHWHRTAAAVLALRTDAAAALSRMRQHEMKLNAVFQASRNLAEMAICESQLEGGFTLGELDLSRLMAMASQIYHLGGWSDLAYWGFLQPRLVIRPLGDVHANHDFVDTVMDGFGNATSDYRFMASVRRYEENLRTPEASPEAREHLDAEFLEAWRDESGVELDAFRRFIDAVENWCIELGEPVVTIRRSALEAMADDSTVGARILEWLSFLPRSSWRELPAGNDEKDIAPWRFRRRLSTLRRPLLQLSTDTDPEILVAPGLLRDGFGYAFGNYFYGSYADRHLGPAMRKYAGHARRRDGMKFNAEVAEKMRHLGWQAKTEIAITKVVGRALDRDYGDVDVLAWHSPRQRILVMECKDLQFRKTYGEIAEQLVDFAGVNRPDGKADALRKHLDRVQVLKANHGAVCRFLELGSGGEIESHLVFRNPVPMQHVAGPLSEQCTLHTLDGLEAMRLNTQPHTINR